MTRPLLILAALSIASPAMAQDCQMPRARESFSGTVVRVIDGDTIRLRTANCSALQVRLADFSAPERNEFGGSAATFALRAIATGRPAYCTSVRGRNGSYRSYGRQIAICRINGVSLGDSLRAAGVMEGGR